MPPSRRSKGGGPDDARLQNLPPHLKMLIANFCNSEDVANVCAAGVTDFKQQFQSVVLEINNLKTKFIGILRNMNNTGNTTNKQNSIIYSKEFLPKINAAFHQLSYTVYHAIKNELDTFAEIREMPADEQGLEFVKQMWDMCDIEDKYATYNAFIDDLYEGPNSQTNTLATDKVAIEAYWRHFKTQYPGAVIRGKAYTMLRLLLQIRGTEVSLNVNVNEDGDIYTIVRAMDDPAIVAEIAQFLESIGAVATGGGRRASKVKARRA